MLGINPKDSPAMVAEAMDMILRLWSSGAPIEIKGKF